VWGTPANLMKERNIFESSWFTVMTNVHEHLLYTYTGLSTSETFHLSFSTLLFGSYYYHLQIDEEIEAYRDEVTCSRLQSK
jgi:hypothetical protein